MRPLEKGPFYAVRVVPGGFGTFAGVDADVHARARREDGTAIDGLWVAGNDHASIRDGHYPAGGINLGPALTFGTWLGSMPPDAPDSGASSHQGIMCILVSHSDR